MAILYAGIEGGGTSWRAAIASGHPTNIIKTTQIDTLNDPSKVLSILKEWLATHKHDALGISTFGPIDNALASNTFGYIKGTPNKPFWKNIDVVGCLWNKSTPCKFDTDVNAPALAEHRFGRAHGKSSCAYITVGTGVGAGFVVNGVPLTGLIHPEAGHTCVPARPDFPMEASVGACTLHAGGCVGGIASTLGISYLTGVPRLQLAQLPRSHPVWDRVAHALGILCYNIILMVSPEQIIIHGGVMHRDFLYSKIRRVVKTLLKGYLSHPLLEERIDEYIVPSTWGQRAGVVGALTLAAEAYTEKCYFQNTTRFCHLSYHEAFSSSLQYCRPFPFQQVVATQRALNDQTLLTRSSSAFFEQEKCSSYGAYTLVGGTKKFLQQKHQQQDLQQLPQQHHSSEWSLLATSHDTIPKDNAIMDGQGCADEICTPDGTFNKSVSSINSKRFARISNWAHFYFFNILTITKNPQNEMMSKIATVLLYVFAVIGFATMLALAFQRCSL